jgi:hypothetical protein
MCLSRLDRKTLKPRVGWKLFRYQPRFGKTHTTPICDTRLSSEKWNLNRSGKRLLQTIGYGNSKPYLSGYHVYAKRADAFRIALEWGRAWCMTTQKNQPRVVVRKVELRRVVASGRQDGCSIIVARALRICKNQGR